MLDILENNFDFHLDSDKIEKIVSELLMYLDCTKYVKDLRITNQFSEKGFFDPVYRVLMINNSDIKNISSADAYIRIMHEVMHVYQLKCILEKNNKLLESCLYLKQNNKDNRLYLNEYQAYLNSINYIVYYILKTKKMFEISNYLDQIINIILNNYFDDKIELYSPIEYMKSIVNINENNSSNNILYGDILDINQFKLKIKDFNERNYLRGSSYGTSIK